MKIYLALIICVSFTLAQEPPLPPEPTEPGPPSPSKHPFQKCLETYNTCVQNVGHETWEPQQACLLDYYKCQNEYTAKCRKLYRNDACYNLIGKDKCLEKLRDCYGSS